MIILTSERELEGMRAAWTVARLVLDEVCDLIQLGRATQATNRCAAARIKQCWGAIQNYVQSHGCSVVRQFVGHGVGRSMHEEPQVPNFDDGKSSPKLRPGMTLAIEPMVNAGSREVKVLKDGWTVVTKDGQLSAHFEHTVLVTESEPEILTCPGKMLLKLKAQ